MKAPSVTGTIIGENTYHLVPVQYLPGRRIRGIMLTKPGRISPGARDSRSRGLGCIPLAGLGRKKEKKYSQGLGVGATLGLLRCPDTSNSAGGEKPSGKAPDGRYASAAPRTTPHQLRPAAPCTRALRLCRLPAPILSPAPRSLSIRHTIGAPHSARAAGGRVTPIWNLAEPPIRSRISRRDFPGTSH